MNSLVTVVSWMGNWYAEGALLLKCCDAGNDYDELLDQWFLTLLEVLNPARFVSAFTQPFVIGKIKYDTDFSQTT